MKSLVYKERLLPSTGTFLALLLSFPLVLLSAAPFGWGIALPIAALATSIVVLLAIVSSPVIEISQVLRAGNLNIPLEALGNVEVYENEEARLQRGPKLDARARLKIRGDVGPVVKIEISDPKDPTPYVLISSRRPKELASALGADFTVL